ncbi:hypothetical protein [Streptomyces mirabilis]
MAATADRTATPIESPTSWKVLTTPEASPASSWVTVVPAAAISMPPTAVVLLP